MNPTLLTFEAIDCMYSFDATPMAPVGTKILIHLKPIRRHTWDYHTRKAHYFSPSLPHYRVIKALTETGSVHLIDTWKFKHQVIKVPTVTPTDRIVQATRQLTAAIQGTNDTPPNELEAIEHLRALIMAGNSSQPLSTPSVPTPAKVSTEALSVAPTVMSMSATAVLPAHSPPVAQNLPNWNPTVIVSNNPDTLMTALNTAYISDDKEDNDLPFEDPSPAPRYNLWSRQNLANAINGNIDPGLIPATYVNHP